MNVLVVEDSAPTRDLLVRALGDAGMHVVTAARVSSGLRLVRETAPDVIVLDLMLPDGDGLGLCRELRAGGVTTPILCLSARGEVADRVLGLEAGADDYLRKPFAIAELRARIHALARRGGVSPPRRLEVGDVQIDFTARRLVAGTDEVPLTGREWAVLEYLAAREGRVVARDALLEDVWHGSSAAASESLEVILSRLRRKLEPARATWGLRTVRGEGVVFERTR